MKRSVSTSQTEDLYLSSAKNLKSTNANGNKKSRVESNIQDTTYAIVVSDKTLNMWGSVVLALSEKYNKAPIFNYEETVAETKSKLQTCGCCLRHVAFVAHWSECGEQFVRSIHRLTRSIDGRSPFSDVIWGIITGYDESEALKMVTETNKPLTIQHVVSGSVEGVDLRAFQSGVAFNELVQRHSVEKEEVANLLGTGGDDVWLNQDSTLLIANAIEDSRTNMIITSGHARESEWNIGYGFPGGQFRPSPNGSMHAFPLGQSIGPDAIPVDTNTTVKDISTHTQSSREICSSTTVKVYSAAGNCLMGHINSQHCMALAWMKSCGVRQMFGYTVSTWYGFAGWGVHRYLWANVGDLTFSQAYFANQQALQLGLMQANEEATKTSTNGRKSQRRLQGLMFDSDATVFFGDPAWEARMVPKWRQYDITCDISTDKIRSEMTITCTVKTLTSGCWTPTCPDDKTTLPGRPPFMLLEAGYSASNRLPTHVSSELVITPLFILIPLSGEFSAEEVYVRKVVMHL